MMVTECGTLGVPRFRVALKAIEAGDAVMGVIAVPSTKTDSGLLVAL